MTNAHITPRKFLAKELQRLRESKGIKRTDVAKAIFVSEELVRSWEKGRRLPLPDYLAKLEELYGTAGTLTELREDLVTAAVPLEWFGRWPEIEQQAAQIWSSEVAVLPGLLQTEAYATAVLRAANLSADLEEMVAARLERQRILIKEDPAVLVALIPEGALRNNVGGAAVMREQLLHLAEMARRDNVIVHVIPFSAPAACAAYIAPFAIADFDGGNGAAYIDNAISGEVIENIDDVRRLRRLFDTLRADALDRQASIQLILRMAEQWKP
jgi:transcriptional regulator with XRE-family HTH domain